MLDKLKSLFVISEETKDEPKNSENKTPEKSIVPSSTPPKTQNFQNIKGEMSQTIFERLLGVLNTNNQQGFDYIEFKNSLKALEKMGMDEKTMYRSAFATAQTIGASVQGITDSIDFYKKILQKESTDFAEAVKQQIESKLSDKEKEIDDFKIMIDSKQKQIEALQAEIQKHKESIATLSSKIESDKTQINKTKSDFDVTFESIMQQINTDAAKIKEYLI